MSLLKEKAPAVAGVLVVTAALAWTFHGALSPPGGTDAASAPGGYPGSVPRASAGRKIAVKTKNGGTRDLAEPSDRIRVVHFWATWCAPCVEEFPGLVATWRKLRDRRDIEFVLVSVDDAWKTVDPWLSARKAAELPMYLDPTRNAAKAFGTEKFPETWILAPDGSVLAHVAGPMDWTSPGVVRQLDELAAALPKRS